MKMRIGFVTNSSSSSYLIWLKDVSYNEAVGDNEFNRYFEEVEEEIDCCVDDDYDLKNQIKEQFETDMDKLKTGDLIFQSEDYHAYNLGTCFEIIYEIDVSSDQGFIQNINTKENHKKIAELYKRIEGEL